jgi:pterin-4a-carbinolamine dehydratase
MAERRTLTEERMRLRYDVTVEDADFLTAPATLTQQWDHHPDL